MTEFRAKVTLDVVVCVDDSAFDEKFMEEFRQSFYQFYTLEDHVSHIAQLEARGLLEDFTEGYDPIRDFGITADTIDWEVEIEAVGGNDHD